MDSTYRLSTFARAYLSYARSDWPIKLSSAKMTMVICMGVPWLWGHIIPPNSMRSALEAPNLIRSGLEAPNRGRSTLKKSAMIEISRAPTKSQGLEGGSMVWRGDFQGALVYGRLWRL